MPELSIVVPAHNSGPRLRRAIDQLAAGLDGIDAEVIVVENGSSDCTWREAQRLADLELPFRLTACQSSKGLGAAYQEGIRRASGETVLLTADDLPFGLSDIASWRRMANAEAIVIGSKAHPRSVVPRSPIRGLLSNAYRLLRLVILRMRVADCQGTIFVPRQWLAARLKALLEHGYLASTEIVYLAQLQQVRIIEVPVTLQQTPQDGRTRIRLGDIWEMAVGLLRLRRRRTELTVVGS